MLCRKCNKKQAAFFISREVLGEAIKLGFCDACADQSGIFSALQKVESLLHGYGLSASGDSPAADPEMPLEFAEECRVCGTELREFEREFTLGCDQCCHIFGSLLFSVTLLPSFALGTQSSASLYTELGRRMALAGEPLNPSAGPVIANFPIWMAWAHRVESLGLPDEPPADVLDLAAAFPGSRLLVVIGDDHGAWPAVLDTNAPGSDCFTPVDLGPPPPGATPDPLANVHVYVIGCP